jgi:hypothetical protein
LKIFNLDTIQGRKRVINRRCRLKKLILEDYPKFLKLCHQYQIECPEENSWAFNIYKNETITGDKKRKEPEKTASSITPEKSSVKMSRQFRSPPATKLLTNVAEDDDNGKIIKEFI